MFTAIVPVQNEESRVGRLLGRLLSLNQIRRIFVILNGSNRPTRMEVESVYKKNKGMITLVSFKEALGIDVPRAIGAKLAYSCNSPYALFVDGDLVGEITKELSAFLTRGARLHLDLALMNCYPHCTESNLQEPMFYFRRLLNKELGLYQELGIATPSHGPHIVSKRMLAAVPWPDFCIPPTLLVHAVWHKLRIGIAADIPHLLLGSSLKSGTHSQRICDTIAGDCLEALYMSRNLSRSRSFKGRT
ncbi:MAG: glycosyl transferase family 2, partial [Bacillota bacterium]|nr:glycosyl transferase family 2 [Bacillota bacterium]